MARKKPSRAVLIFFALAALGLALPALVGLYVDSLWFREIGYTVVFHRELMTRFLLFAGTGVAAFAMLFGNLKFAQRGISLHPIRLRSAPNQEPVVLTDMVERATLLFALFFSVTTALAAMSSWLTVLRFINSRPFGVADPVLGRDVGYYVFTMPMIEWAIALALSLSFITLFALLAVYWVRGDLAILPGRMAIEPAAGVHIASVVAAIFVLFALRNHLIAVPQLLFGSSEQIQGATYADIAVRIPALRVAAIVALMGAAFVLFGAMKRRAVWHTALAAGAYFLVTAVGGGVIPALVQRFVVAPNELTSERAQLESHIAATRTAWGLSDVTIRDIEGDDALTLEDLRNNVSTIENVRLWDRDPLLQTFGQLQEIRTYYDFVNVDDDRYWIDGRYRQVLLAARELNTASLQTRNFINTHLTFTHGMGITLSPVNQVTGEGLPVLFIKDLPPESNVNLQVTRPQIYFGEVTNEFALVNTRHAEFDYPAGDTAATTVYSGAAGIRLGSPLRRALLAAHFQSFPLLLSNDADSDSRIIINREITSRAARALPFLRFDSDPYLVIDTDGTLKWIMDAYTATSNYPYSRRLTDGTNYMRNSVKVVLDAYDGSIRSYVSDPADPIVQSLEAAFPGVFLPLDSISQSLRAHLRYPEDLFRAQTLLYSTYHMTEPRTFYNREDQWQIPVLDDDRAARSPFLRHIVMRLPEEDSAEFIFMTPYTPSNKDNLAAWMVVRNDGEHYGELVVYRFPKQSLVFGPRQVVNRINQDTEIARQIALWDQRGSQVIRGQLLVIPIEESLIYVQPLYLRAEGGRIPELKRVVVAYQNRVVMEETLDRGLAMIFGADDGRGAPLPPSLTAEPGAPPSTDARVTEILRQLQSHYDRAMTAQREGNWAEYGTEIQRVGELLRELGTRIPPGTIQ